MLQEATKALNSAFNNSFIKKVSQYLHDCVREEVKSSTFRNLKGDKDNKWIFLKEQETLLTEGLEYLKLDGANPNLEELRIQSNNNKDKYLIYGYMFLVGRNGKSKRYNEFLTPLLYAPCRLERNGVNINCIRQDDFLSLNTGAIASLIKKGDDDDEVDSFLEGILDVVPDVPITKEKMDIFLTTLKAIIPDIEIVADNSEDADEDNVTRDETPQKDYSDTVITGENLEEIIEQDIQQQKQKYQGELKKLCVTYQSAIILTKRPSVTAGVLHELLQIAEKPSGIYRETTLSVINDEYNQNIERTYTKDDESTFYPITPLSLSDSQEKVIKNIENSKLIAVQGPPGTGKSQTIVNLAAHLIANGKTVLIASRMDKAVDVVADRLNALGAPYLALRAGRTNYQRQLKTQLEDLVSSKVDLDDDVEDYIFSDVKDMHKHLDIIRETEGKCEKIIKLEKAWHDLRGEIKEHSLTIGDMQYIKRPLKKSEIDNVNDVIKTLTDNMEKAGFFASLKNMSSLRQLKKVLNIKEFSVESENLDRLKVELGFVTEKWKLRKIEADIQKIGNLHVMMEQVRQLKRKQKGLAINILKSTRREALKNLMHDANKVQRIKRHARTLTERKSKQEKILKDEDFRPLLEAFPCWCVTTYAVSDSLPLKPGMFDVAIIDEASQCDIASCFPIMYRAKRSVIVGDDKQLPHLSFLEKAKEQSFLSQYGIPDRYQLMWRFRTNSMFDLADYYSMNSVMLDEHFRSLPPVIDFSNKEFYSGRIRIMRKDPQNYKALELIKVPEGKVDSDATRNIPEVEELVKVLHEIIIEDERNNPENPTTIGIISPFRAQVEQLKISVPKVISDYMIKKHQIEIGTAHTFQGDERDIMLISWAFANNSFPQSVTFLQKPNLFNVAITRAKNKCINFVSHDIETMPEGHFRNYVSYIRNYEERKIALANDEIDANIYKNKFEKEVADKIRELDHRVVAGADIAGLSADLLVDDSFIIEIDGVEDNKRSNVSAMKKQAILERCGLKVKRITFREWQYSQKACLDRVLTIE